MYESFPKGEHMEQLTVDQVQVQDESPAGDAPGQNTSKIVSQSLPILHSLRARIRAYAKLWCIAGAMTLLLALPAARERNLLLALTTVATGLSVLFFSVIRIIESKSLSAIIEVDRSDLKRKVWLVINAVVFSVATAIFTMSVLRTEPPFNPWTALPISAFLMIVSISPFWEWFFVRRVIHKNKALLEDFNRLIQILYKTDEERRIALLAIDALMILETMRNKKALSDATYQNVLKELLKLDSVI